MQHLCQELKRLGFLEYYSQEQKLLTRDNVYPFDSAKENKDTVASTIPVLSLLGYDVVVTAPQQDSSEEVKDEMLDASSNLFKKKSVNKEIRKLESLL